MQFTKKSNLIVTLLGIAALSATSLIAQRMMQQPPPPQEGQQAMPQMMPEPVTPSMSEEFAAEKVMVINGEEITMGDLKDIFIGQLVDHIAESIDPELAALFYDSEAGRQMIREYTMKNLDDLKTQFVIRQEIDKQGIEITEADKQEYFAHIMERIEMMKQQQQVTEEQILQQLGVPSLEALQERVVEEQAWSIKVQKLLDAEVYDQVEVTEEQAREFFEQQGALMGIPEDMQFEDIKAQIVQQLRQMEGQALVEQYISDLKEDADIQVVLQ